MQNSQSRFKKGLAKSNSTFKALPTLQVASAGNYSDAGNKMPAIGNAQNSAKPAFKKMLIDQSTLPNSNLSPSEINKINDMHN